MARRGQDDPTIRFIDESSGRSPKQNLGGAVGQMALATPVDVSQIPAPSSEKPTLPTEPKDMAAIEDKIKKAALQHPTPTGHKFVQDDSKEDKLTITRTTPGKGGVDWVDVQIMANTCHGNGYEFIRHIDGGSHGQVYEVKLIHTRSLKVRPGTRFAMKIMKIPENMSKEERTRRLAKQCTEACILMEMASGKQVHPNLLNPYEIVTRKGLQQVYFIMKLSVFGTLKSLALTHWFVEKKSFMPQEIKHLTSGIGDGIRFLKQHYGVAHSDLKPENILLFDNPQKTDQHDVYLPKLCDFSNSVKKNPEDGPEQCTANGMRCTLGYHAPETYHQDTNKRYNAFAADVYSFGALIYWMWRRLKLSQSLEQFKKNPYHEDNIKHVLSQQHPPEVSKKIDELVWLVKKSRALNDTRPLKDVLERSLQWDFKKRITIEQMLSQEYFK